MDKVNVWIVKRKAKRGLNYAVQWLDPQTGQRKTESVGHDKAYARQKAANLRQELLTGRYKAITTISYDDFAVGHLEAISGMLAEGTCVEHEWVLRQFKTLCKPKDLTVIDFAMLERFRNARQQAGASPATINKGLRTLQAILERAVQRNYLKVNPFKGNRQNLLVREPEPVPVVLEPANFKALLGACLNDRWRTICTIGYYTGLRQGEILALEWDDIDFDNRLLHVRNKEGHSTKSRKNRIVPMTAEVVSAIQTLQYRRFQSRYVFTNDENLDRKIRNNVNRDFAAIVMRAGLVDEQDKPRFSMHDLRRSFVTNLLATGTDPQSVKELAGHADITTTMKHYAAVRAKNLTAAIDRLSLLSAAAV